MRVSIVSSPELAYPEADDRFSPDSRYPEYPFDAVSSRPNPVYAAIRRLFAQIGLDRERYDTPDWNPLGEFVRRGDSVFVLCNFVYHRRPQETLRDLWGKCTHGSVLRALIDYVLIATGPDATVRFGNSPLQSCSWKRVLADTRADVVAEFYRGLGLRVEPTDLRLFVAERSPLGHVRQVERRDDREAAVEIDLGADSLLSELPASSAGFRVSDYDPRRIEAFHHAGSHRYVIHRAVLESDVILSLPKLKTHEKVGITCGLKGFVGAVGHKDCLAHHRFGNPRRGGDEYPDRLTALRAASTFHDWVNRRGQDAPLQRALQVCDRTLRRALRRSGMITSGAWHGNDTCWRMAVDLARILNYAGRDGTLSDQRRRRHLMLLDGVIAGEGNGPLTPRPADARALLFADDIVAGDRVAARLMGFDPRDIPMLREAARPFRYALWDDAGAVSTSIVTNRDVTDETALAPVLGRPFEPPRGWVSRLRSAS